MKRSAAVSFAYRGRGHADAVDRVRRSQADLLDRYAAGCFEPYRCEGTWEGANVLAQAGASS